MTLLKSKSSLDQNKKKQESMKITQTHISVSVGGQLWSETWTIPVFVLCLRRELNTHTIMSLDSLDLSSMFLGTDERIQYVAYLPKKMLEQYRLKILYVCTETFKSISLRTEQKLLVIYGISIHLTSTEHEISFRAKCDRLRVRGYN